MQPRSQFLHSGICERFMYSQDRSAYLAAAKKADRSWDYIKRTQIHECGNREKAHYNSVLEITRLRNSFLGTQNRNQTFILDSHQPSFAVCNQ